MFFCKFCEISEDTFFYRTPPVAASARIMLKQEKSYKLLKAILKNGTQNILQKLCHSKNILQMYNAKYKRKVSQYFETQILQMTQYLEQQAHDKE